MASRQDNNAGLYGSGQRPGRYNDGFCQPCRMPPDRATKIPFYRLDPPRFDALLQGAQTIEADGSGLKVAQLAGGDFLKLYRRKRCLSRALWSPPARRFAEHAVRLRTLGIATPAIVAWLRVTGLALTAVRYRPLPGETLRQRWPRLHDTGQEQAIADEVTQFGALLGRLHQLGVYFRSVHLGNVLRLPDGGLGLIDLADLRLHRRALSRHKRRRNLQHILRYREDAAWLLQHRAAWLQGYAQTGGRAVSILADALQEA